MIFRGVALWIAERLPPAVIYFAVLRARREIEGGCWPDGEWVLRHVFCERWTIINLN